jgi:hypothetical protein
LNARIQRNSVRTLPGVDTGGRLAAPDAALDGIEVSDWPSLLTAPLTGRNSPPPGSAPRSA